MYKRFPLIAAAAVALFPSLVFADMPYTPAIMSDSGFHSSAPRRTVDTSGSQQSQASAAPATAPTDATDAISDLLSFSKQLNLSGQQVISIQMIGSDAKVETSKRQEIVIKRQQELTQSMSQFNPNFADIRTRMQSLADAQTSILSGPVDAYEKAYTLLTDQQKASLAFFKANRQKEIEKKAKAAQESTQSPTPTPRDPSSPPPVPSH